MKGTKIQDVHVPKLKLRDQRMRPRLCNLCTNEFKLRTVFDRYCVSCKEENELLRFSEWLPEIDAEITERLSA